MCSVFSKVKIFSICAICYEKSIYLLCRQNCPRTCVSSVSWDSAFIYSSLKLPGKAQFSLWMSLAPFVAIADGKHCFLWTINMDFCLHKAEFISGVLVTKKIGNLLILYIAKTEAILDINISSIKLHELYEFDKKKLLAE